LSSPLVEWLKKVKRRPMLALPDEPEELATLLRRIDTPQHAAEITAEHYFGLIKRNHVVVRLPLHAFALDASGCGVRLFWLDHERRSHGALRLTPAEVEELARLCRPPELLGRRQHAPAEAGHGSLRLKDLLPGESFVTASGEVCRVAREQEENSRYVAVWRRAATVDARKEPWPGETCVFATCPEQGQRLQRRVAARGRRARRRAA